MQYSTRDFARCEPVSSAIQEARAARPLHPLPRAFPLQPGVQRKATTDQQFDHLEVDRLIKEAMRSWSDDKAKAQIIHAPAGTGKTTMVVQKAAAGIRSGKIDGVVLHLVATHKLGNEVREKYERSDVRARVCAGQSQEDACARAETAKEVANLGLKTTALCGGDGKPECTHKSSCSLLKARRSFYENPPAVIVAPIEYIRSGGLPEEAQSAALVVIDESVHDTMIRHGSLNTAYLGKVWCRSLEDSESEAVAYETLAQVSSHLQIEANTADPVAALIERYGIEGAHAKVKEIIRLRRKELSHRLGGVDANTTPEHVSGARLPEYYKSEIALWQSIKFRIDAQRQGREPSSYVPLRKDDTAGADHQSYIEYIDRLPFPFGAPVLVLDASADEEIYDRLFSGTHHVEYLRYARPVDTLERTAILGLSCSKTSLLGFKKSAEDGRDREDERLKRVATVEGALDAIAQREEGRSILLVASGAVIEALKSGEIGQNFMKKAAPQLVHFGGLRGLNEYETCDTTVLLGKLEPDDASARRIAIGISKTPEQVMSQPEERARTTARIAMRDGREGEIETSTYSDPDTARVLYQIREEEIVQAEQRIRSAQRHGQDIRSYIIGDAVPEDFEFDLVYDIRDFRKSKVQEVADAYHGCLSTQAYEQRHSTQRARAGKALKGCGFVKSECPDGWTAFKAKLAGAKGAPMHVYSRETGEAGLDAAKAHACAIKEWPSEQVQVSAA